MTLFYILNFQPGEQYCKLDENDGIITCLSCYFVINQSKYLNEQTEYGSSTISDQGLYQNFKLFYKLHAWIKTVLIDNAVFRKYFRNPFFQE